MVLSSQWMDGRLPGTPVWNVPRTISNTTVVGLQPAVEPRTDILAVSTSIFPAPISSDGQAMATVVNGELDEFRGDTDFVLTGMGSGTDGFAGCRFCRLRLEVEGRDYTNFSKTRIWPGKWQCSFDLSQWTKTERANGPTVAGHEMLFATKLPRSVLAILLPL